MSVKNIKVSIIIAAYNGENYIQETVQSCLKQSHECVEIIIVDDCSSDKTYEIVEKLAAFNDNIFTFRNSLNLGFIRTCNWGARKANGRYICFLGQDDVLPRNHINQMLQETFNNVSFLFCDSLIINSSNQIIKNTKKDQYYINAVKRPLEILSRYNFIKSTGLLIDKERFFKVGGFDEKYKNYGEWYLWVKLLSVGELVYVSSTKAKYRRHERNITNTFIQKKIFDDLFVYQIRCRFYAFKKVKNKNVIFILFFLYYLLLMFIKELIYKIIKK